MSTLIASEHLQDLPAGRSPQGRVVDLAVRGKNVLAEPTHAAEPLNPVAKDVAVPLNGEKRLVYVGKQLVGVGQTVDFMFDDGPGQQVLRKPDEGSLWKQLLQIETRCKGRTESVAPGGRKT
jgi:hypothetical protein